jgi:hypothetical protein
MPFGASSHRQQDLKEVLENLLTQAYGKPIYEPIMKRILIAPLIFMVAPLSMAHATGYAGEKKTARAFVNLPEANNPIFHSQAITWTVQRIIDRRIGNNFQAFKLLSRLPATSTGPRT